MDNFKNTKVSYFKGGIAQTTDAVDMTLEHVFKAIKTGQWKKQIEFYKALPDGPVGSPDYKAKKAHKKTLPNWTPTGTYSKREGSSLTKHSGFISLDFDDLGDTGPDVRDVLAQDPLVSFASLSASGNVFILVKMPDDPALHGDYFEYCSDHFLELYKLEADPAAKDLPRSRFVSYDPDCIVNDRPLLEGKFVRDYLTTKKANQRPKPEPQQTPPAASQNPVEGRFIEFKKSTAIKMIADATDGNKHHARVKASILLGGCVPQYITESEAKDVLIGALEAAGSNSTDAVKTIDWGLKKGQNYPLVDSFIPNTSRAKNTDTEPDDLETLPQKPAEFFPDQLIPLLPDFMQELCNGLKGRELDMAIISQLTVGSYAAKKCSGLYIGHNLYAPFFTMIAGPSGSGKGRAGYANAFLKDIEQEMFDANDRARGLWDIDRHTAKKSDQPAPPAPPVLRAMIPANSTYAAMMNALGDNPAGLYFFDSEGSGIAQALKSEHGDYKDIFLKAPGHELIESMRAKERSVRVDCPKLAALVTCVPSQLWAILKNPDSGFFGRFLFYVYNENTARKSLMERQPDQKARHGQYAGLFYNIASLPGFVFELTDTQNFRVDNFLSGLDRDYTPAHPELVMGIVSRLGQSLFRVAMVLERFLLGVTYTDRVVCSDRAFDAAMMIVSVLAKHTFGALDKITAQKILTDKPTAPAQEKKARESENKSSFFAALPKTFTTKEFVEIAKANGTAKSTAEFWVSKWHNDGYLNKPKTGLYSKK